MVTCLKMPEHWVNWAALGRYFLLKNLLNKLWNSGMGPSECHSGLLLHMNGWEEKGNAGPIFKSFSNISWTMSCTFELLWTNWKYSHKESFSCDLFKLKWSIFVFTVTIKRGSILQSHPLLFQFSSVQFSSVLNSTLIDHSPSDSCWSTTLCHYTQLCELEQMSAQTLVCRGKVQGQGRAEGGREGGREEGRCASPPHPRPRAAHTSTQATEQVLW